MYGIFRNIAVLLLLIFKNKFTAKRLFQGKMLKKLKRAECYWINASSVGEINLADTTVKKILSETKCNILITVMTDTGLETAQKKYEGNSRIDILFFPLDSKKVINKILKIVEIKKLILIETEIWPNLINEVSKKAEIIMINGRISDKSFPKYLKISWLLGKNLNKISYCLMQTEKDKDRIVAIGASAEKVFVTGNLKFDIKTEEYSEDEKKNLRDKFFLNGKKVIVAGSTHPSEEEYWLRKVEKIENYTLFIVPRHINRVDEIEEKYLNGKYNFERWSTYSGKECNVVLVDAMGVLRKLYSICDVAFVGGTIANVGGHSLLEPLAYGRIPIFGKNYQNTKEIAEEITRTGIGIIIDENSNMDEVFPIAEQDKKKEIEKFFEKNKNVLEKNMKYILT